MACRDHIRNCAFEPEGDSCTGTSNDSPDRTIKVRLRRAVSCLLWASQKALQWPSWVDGYRGNPMNECLLIALGHSRSAGPVSARHCCFAPILVDQSTFSDTSKAAA
jgi:hypothetical protein